VLGVSNDKGRHPNAWRGKKKSRIHRGGTDRQLQQLWAETKIGDILPWDDVEREAERLLESTRANARDSKNSRASQEQDEDRIVDRDEADPYDEVIFGRRRPDSVAIEWTSKTLYILEFKRTSDQRQDYRERGECHAQDQHDVLVKSLETVAKEAEGESAGWTVKLIIFVEGACGSVHVQTFNSNLKELGVVESERNAILRGFVTYMSCRMHRTRSCAHILHKEWVRKIVVKRVRDHQHLSGGDGRQGLGGGGRVGPGRAGPRGCAGQLQGHGSRRHCAALRLRRCSFVLLNKVETD